MKYFNYELGTINIIISTYNRDHKNDYQWLVHHDQETRKYSSLHMTLIIIATEFTQIIQ